MSAAGVPPAAASEGLTTSYVQWSAVIAGAIAAAGVSFTLLAFGAGIGLSVLSTAPTWRDSSAWLWVLSGLFWILVALCAFGLGGYISGRTRTSYRAIAVPETEFHDGVHGIVTWGLAILLTAMIGLMGASALSPAVVSSGSSAGPSVAGETMIASELDQLLRTNRTAIPETNIAYRRAEAARILLKSGGHVGISSEEQNYLAQIVVDRTGLPMSEAASRTERIIGASAQELHRARVASVLQAFMVAAGLLLGAAVAWYSAVEGGRDRQNNRLPVWDWRLNRSTVIGRRA